MIEFYLARPDWYALWIDADIGAFLRGERRRGL